MICYDSFASIIFTTKRGYSQIVDFTVLHTVIGHDDLIFELNPLVKSEFNSKPPNPLFVFG